MTHGHGHDPWTWTILWEIDCGSGVGCGVGTRGQRGKNWDDHNRISIKTKTNNIKTQLAVKEKDEEFR